MMKKIMSVISFKEYNKPKDIPSIEKTLCFGRSCMTEIIQQEIVWDFILISSSQNAQSSFTHEMYEMDNECIDTPVHCVYNTGQN